MLVNVVVSRTAELETTVPLRSRLPPSIHCTEPDIEQLEKSNRSTLLSGKVLAFPPIDDMTAIINL